MKAKIKILVAALSVALNSWANGTCINGLYYILAGDSAIVTYAESGSQYSGNIVIPPSISFNQKTYSVTSVGEQAFYNCTSVTSVTIPNSVTSIGTFAFGACASLSSITIPNSVTSIESYAFAGCSSLPVVDNLRYADTYLVEAVDKTRSTYTIRVGTKWIGNEAFMFCNSLSFITIPSSVTSIGVKAFLGCTTLTSITIPNSVTNIEGSAFSGCRSLPVIDSIRYADTYLIEAVDKKQSVYTIREGTKWIGTYAFSGCSYLSSFTIPNSVTCIQTFAFTYCTSLTSVTIPNSMTQIEESAFSNCTSLSTITCYATTPPICGYSCFFGVDNSIPLYVPVRSINAYKTADEWMNFTNIQGISAEIVSDPVTDIVTTPSNNSVTITWPTNPNADSYTIEIKKGGVTFCTLTFNAQGQLMNIAFAPGRGGCNDIAMAETVAGGYKFTVTSLAPCTKYTYEVDTKNASGSSIANYTGTFTTTGSTGLDQLTDSEFKIQNSKFIKDGQLYILRDGKMYNAQGGEL